ncbi:MULTISPECIES: ABC transporter permease [Corynebacterium]|uniref:Iron ABC transporter permease n=1 Tax=Corynebacterium gottingense TaxID=2041036 RepID=A0ABX9UJL6_9CORY|nr:MULTISPECIES: iron ABC transporter permease [Corynebacterium]PAT08841.1 iron ABC transporter permease [Corynebacterium hadale]PAT15904.1 iron ABC transporter permease [Corynebacterium sp. NML 120412]RMD19644.1 iron ABC transporter permease [Corynebacterium gottingense]WJZ12991.1 Putative 2-aminoethylphosphonate transport system permease protein PhnV [Corynebacterium gottingense]WJZ15315.1 Putative 2-aminoethylphosphonate transport system permease protein PhnV [Corynebacterium gottingense]
MPTPTSRRITGVGLARLGVWLVVAALFLTPLALVVSLALGGNQIPLLLEQGLGKATLNSAVTTLASSAFAVLLGGAVALLLERTDVYGKGALRILLLSPLLVPPFVGAISWLQLFGNNQGLNAVFGREIWNLYGADGVIFLMTLHSYPLVYVIVAAALRSIPADLELAARISGAGNARVLRTVTLPLLGPAFLSAFTLTAVSNLADFGIPSILGSPVRFETLATMVYRMMESGIVANPLQVVSTIGTVLLVLGIVAVVADYVVSARAANTTHTGASMPLPLGKSRAAVSVVAWIVALALTLGPLIGLTYRALLPAPGVPFTLENISLSNFQSTLENPRVIEGFTNSVTLALGAALLCGLLGWAVGLLVTRTRARSNTALTLIVLLPTALPGLIIGVGWVIYGRYTDLYNTRWVILLAYVCAFTALVLQAVRAPLASMPAAVEEAARISGAGRLRAMLDTTGRMAIPAVVSGAVLVAVTAVRELTVSILLIAPGTTTIGVQLFNLQQSGNYNQASALALMFAVIGIVALALTIRNPERSAK